MIIEADADDLAGIGDHRIEGNLLKLEIRRSALRLARGVLQRVGGDQGFKIGVLQARREIDDIIAVDQSVVLSAAGAKGKKFHLLCSWAMALKFALLVTRALWTSNKIALRPIHHIGRTGRPEPQPWVDCKRCNIAT